LFCVLCAAPLSPLLAPPVMAQGKGDTLVVSIDTSTVTIDWLGWITFNGPYRGIDPGFYGGGPPPTQYYRDDIEIGLRSDGVVVWRKQPKK